MTSKQIILATAMAFIAVPASATGNSSDQKSDKNAGAVDSKKYCIAYDNIVGSRVSRQECKTKAEWAKDRVDIDKMLKE
jgi:hypothetical protein